VARHVVALAEVEDLPAHGQAVTARFRERGTSEAEASVHGFGNVRIAE